MAVFFFVTGLRKVVNVEVVVLIRLNHELAFIARVCEELVQVMLQLKLVLGLEWIK
jgi:hypothetical protein